jgi:hypothetical protein
MNRKTNVPKARRAFLCKPLLRSAKLISAKLISAKLISAKLISAKLISAKLISENQKPLLIFAY